MSQSPKRPPAAAKGRPSSAAKQRPGISDEANAAGSGPARDAAAVQPRVRGAAAVQPRARDAAAVQPRVRGAGREALVAAARAEFEEVGYEHTDTNRIARRAGYAPQTFYRHFADKAAIFIEIYTKWFDEEWKDLEDAQAAGPEATARVVLKHHARHREFRRSLRRLTVRDPAVRAARAASRERQAALLEQRGEGPEDRVSRFALLLCIERIADAAAEGELDDLGLSRKSQVAMLADVIARLGAKRSGA
jgi:AcrR family transcriptional regulator